MSIHFTLVLNMDWIANTEIGLDPINSVINRLRCIIFTYAFSPLCLVWVRAPLWPHVRQAFTCVLKILICCIIFSHHKNQIVLASESLFQKGIKYQNMTCNRQVPPQTCKLSNLGSFSDLCYCLISMAMLY